MNEVNRCRCDVLLVGNVKEDPEFYYDSRKESFYRFELVIDRLSGVQDVIPVVVPENMVTASGSPIKAGERIKVIGTYKSYNRPKDDGRFKLILEVYAHTIEATDEVYTNSIKMNGYLCKIGEVRKTPNGRVICDMTVAVNRARHKSDYIPAITWSGLAENASKYELGSLLAVEGRIQSRVYNKTLEDGTTESRTAYEVSVNNLTKLKVEKPVNKEEDKVEEEAEAVEE